MRRLSVVVWTLLGLGCAESRELEARLCGDEVFADCFPVGGVTGTFGRFVVETDPERTIVSVRVRFRAEDASSRGTVEVPVEELEPLGCDGEPGDEGARRFSAPVGPLVSEDGGPELSVCHICSDEETWTVEIEVIQRGVDGERLRVYALPGVTLACAF